MTAPTYSYVFDADDRLAMVFRHVYVVQHAPEAPPVSQQLMPNFEMLLVINFGAPIQATMGDEAISVRQTAVLGPLQKTLHYDVPPGADFLVVTFALNGFYRLLGKTLSGATATARFDTPALADLWQQLARVPMSAGRVALFTDYALTHLTPTDSLTELMPDGVALFAQTKVDPVKQLADVQHRTPRHVQGQFQQQLGYSAKALTRFLRFKNTLDYVLEQGPAGIDWSAVAERFGYYDQPHLSRDFQYFLGTSAGRFLRQLSAGTVCVARRGKFY